MKSNKNIIITIIIIIAIIAVLIIVPVIWALFHVSNSTSDEGKVNLNLALNPQNRTDNIGNGSPTINNDSSKEEDHKCTLDKDKICTQCGNFAINKSNCYQAGITSLDGDMIIPKTFKYNDKKYRVTSIGAHGFNGCSGLTRITIPDSVTSIEPGAFRVCDNLTSIKIPDSVTSIGFGAFYKCRSLTRITIPDGITSISKSTFKNCSSLTDINIPDSVTSVEESVFCDCSNLKTITFQGTKTQWNAITKGSGWKDGVPTSCIVRCTDGDLLV